jgi:hypothetical protein
VENNKSSWIAPDFCSGSRRSGGCIRYVFACRNNAEAGQKDMKDGGIYYFPLA